MRAIKTTTISILAVGLLAGSAVGVAAQDDPTAPALVTGTVALVSDTNGSSSLVDGALVIEGTGSVNTWEASDPRLSGSSTYTGNWQRYNAAGFQVEAATRVLENDAGRWVGTATALAGHNFNTDTVILHGEGAYEGLTAYVLMDWHTDPTTFTAAIFAGEMPAFPTAE